MKTRIQKALQYWHYEAACKRIENTPPIVSRDDGLIILSMVNTQHLTMYLVAAKTLHRHLGRGRFLVVDDGTLTNDQRERLQRHLPLVEIVDLASIDRGGLPAGGTWERLALIGELTERNYVVQMDADTLTLNALPEVVQQIERNASFTLDGNYSFGIESIEMASSRWRHTTWTHVQTKAENALSDLGYAPGTRYVRGCSGFAGFGRGTDVAARARDFSARMSRALGAKWNEWGSEQVTSNFLVANAPNPIALHAPAYVNYDGEPIGPQTKFLHFIGPSRFDRGTYRRTSGEAIASLLQAA